MSRMRIDKFDGEYAFLSNFYECPVMYDGLMYQNAEAAYQSAKCTDLAERRKFTNLPPKNAKRLGRHVVLRPDWREIRISVMTAVVEDKFARSPELRKKLLDTAPAELVEGNWWHDTYWGVDSATEEGENHLGQILMTLRDNIQIVSSC